MLVADVALVPVFRVSARSSMRDAAHALAVTGEGTLVVDTDPLSEVTEQNIVRAAALGVTDDTALADLRRDAPDFARSDTTIERALSTMISSGRRSLVVVDEGRVVGLLRLPTAIGTLYGGPSWLGALRIALHVEQVKVGP